MCASSRCGGQGLLRSPRGPVTVAAPVLVPGLGAQARLLRGPWGPLLWLVGSFPAEPPAEPPKFHLSSRTAAQRVTNACSPSATTVVKPTRVGSSVPLWSAPPPAPCPGSCRPQRGFLSPRFYLLHASIRTGPCRLCGWVLRPGRRPAHRVVGACLCRACRLVALQTHQLHPRIPGALQPHRQLLGAGF